MPRNSIFFVLFIVPGPPMFDAFERCPAYGMAEVFEKPVPSGEGRLESRKIRDPQGCESGRAVEIRRVPGRSVPTGGRSGCVGSILQLAAEDPPVAVSIAEGLFDESEIKDKRIQLRVFAIDDDGERALWRDAGGPFHGQSEDLIPLEASQVEGIMMDLQFIHGQDHWPPPYFSRGNSIFPRISHGVPVGICSILSSTVSIKGKRLIFGSLLIRLIGMSNKMYGV